MRRSIHVVAEVQGESSAGACPCRLGIGLIPEAVARTWTSQTLRGSDLIIVKPKEERFAITAALISTEVEAIDQMQS
jgi:hypothetical protein